jgi:hypothetical protein
MNPPVAQFCMRCGAALTLDATRSASVSAQIDVIQRPTPPPQPEAAEITGPAFASQAPPQAAQIPAPPRAEAIAASYAEAAPWSTSSTLELGEAQGSVTAVLALLCVMVSLLGAFAPFLLALCLVGIALAHGVLGFQPILRLGGTRRAAWLESRRRLRWIPWRGSAAPRDFRLIALVALALGYLWLIAIVLQAALLLRAWL